MAKPLTRDSISARIKAIMAANPRLNVEQAVAEFLRTEESLAPDATPAAYTPSPAALTAAAAQQEASDQLAIKMGLSESTTTFDGVTLRLGVMKAKRPV